MQTRRYVLLSLLIWLCAIAGCGSGGNSNDNVSQINAGFFIGETHSGEDLSIAVGSVRAIYFRCAGQMEYQRFDPPEPIAGDGSFAVDMHGGDGITFVVAGEITGNDRIDGTIAGNAACDGSFVARRCNAGTQDCGDRDRDLIPNEVDPATGTSPTPLVTPHGDPTATASGVFAPTATAAATPATTAAATLVPTSTPTPTATPNGLCGNGILDDGEECDKNAIDDSGCFEDVCTCEDFCDDAGGSLSCNANCTLNFSKCTAGGCEFF